MRVYIPLDPEGLARLAGLRSLGPPLRAYAVTPAFEAAYGSDDIDELEYAAMLVAAEASTDPRGCQVVVAADVPEARSVAVEHPAAVEIIGAVPLERVASIHVGSANEELEWYAVQELPQLIRARQ